MKRYMNVIAIAVLALGLSLSGCGTQPKAQNLPDPQVGENGQPPEAEADAGRQDVLGPDKRIVMGFYTDEEAAIPGSVESMSQHLQAMDEVAFFWYSFDGAGNVTRMGNVDLGIKETAQAQGAKAYALVHNLIEGQFDADLAHRVLATAATRSAFVNNLMSLVMNEQWDGISIDIEKTPPADRDNYSAFLNELGKALKAKDKILNVSIPAKYQDYPADLWSGAYDYTAIGEAADQVILMTYDEHGLGTTQGPIASVSWVNRVLDFATGQIPKEKIVMGLPVYAFDWGSDKPNQPAYLSYAQSLERAKAQGVSVLFDENSQESHYTYTSAGVRHEVYLENARSLAAKLENAKEHQLHGVAIWRLGMEDPAMWDNVIKTYGTNNQQ
ncbi:MAG: glycosyl hydrolase family 18 [Peptococcaceae bacterium]|nr:glycosyl hydrolase family 18 [Peptococcaceae bacterium]